MFRVFYEYKSVYMWLAWIVFVRQFANILVTAGLVR